ncbi:hypothetical protein F5Y06DRAFT_305123 [Hypoxylon sp. FL0890]|nr:hypothetical protein F5Y06DRAFT_305123 [Hypoxylon sp. FL0890]
MASSGVTVIVVGLGLAGLTTAIECHQKGHSVIALERSKELDYYDDTVMIDNNAGLIISKWGNGAVGEALKAWQFNNTQASVYDTTGKLVQAIEIRKPSSNKYLILRRELAKIFYDQAKALGIDIRFGTEISDYWEENDHAGVSANGQKLQADCIVWADGVNSKGRAAIVGPDIKPTQSGYSHLRGRADADSLKGDPDAQWILKGAGQEDQIIFLPGPSACLTFVTCGGGRNVAFSNLYKVDSSNVVKTSPTTATTQAFLKPIQSWPFKPKIEAVVRAAASGSLVDEPILQLEQLPSWVSPKGRMILIGDASHPLALNSPIGESLVIEDGAVVAICIELAGKGNIPLALRVAEKIRKPRASALQHNVAQPNEGINLFPEVPLRDWVSKHDSQEHAYKEFDKVVEAIRNGKEYAPTNIS